jgi:ribosomal-protein-alanine N-acetyltransferase
MVTAYPKSIETDRLVFRPPVLEDANAIFAAYAQDPQVTRFMVWRPHAMESETHEFIASCIARWSSGTAFPYVLALKSNDAVVGMLEARPKAHIANIGYVLARAHWGKGLMPEAIRSFTKVALSDLSLFRVEASCDVENLASARALEKSSFVWEGRLARYTVLPNLSSDPRDCWLYAISR